MRTFDQIVSGIKKSTGNAPTQEQVDIFRWIFDEDGHAVVNAVAGSGKTTTLLNATQFIRPSESVLICAFNKHIADELNSRDLPDNASARTLHSAGYAALRRGVSGHVKVKNWKTDDIAKSHVEYSEMSRDEKKAFRKMLPPLRKMISLQKNLGYGILKDYASENQLIELGCRYGLELPSASQWDSFRELLSSVQTLCENEKNLIDFDDMLAIPLREDMAFDTYDWVFVDESQDLNPIQIAMIGKMLKPNGRAIFVGDRHQAIYGFRGADVRAIDSIVEEFGATELPLTVCWRCPSAVIEQAQALVPHIQARPDADEGVVDEIDDTDFTQHTSPGDYVVCRTNAPTVKYCLELLRDNQKATVLGRDIAKHLCNTIDQIIDANLSGDIAEQISEYLRLESERLTQKGLKSWIPALTDRVETIKILSMELGSFHSMKDKIDMIFSDKQVPGITLSTVHKAKGLEADRVFILRPELMPHPMAKQEWEKVQEQNLKYVAITRSGQKLVWVRTSK